MAKKQRPQRTDEVTKAIAIQWWNQETRISPIQKEVVSKHIRPKQKTQHAMHYLLENKLFFHAHEAFY